MLEAEQDNGQVETKGEKYITKRAKSMIFIGQLNYMWEMWKQGI